MSAAITISFKKKHLPLYKQIKKTKPKKVRMAEHGRALMQRGLDCVCSPKVNGKI